MNKDEKAINAIWVITLVTVLGVLSLTLWAIGSYRLAAFVGIAALSLGAAVFVGIV